MDKRRTERVLFLGEQDGVGEQALKQALGECLELNGSVQAAYLARVSFRETPGPQVALCIRGDRERADEFVQCIEKVFHGLFRTSEHLEIIFLSDSQAREIESVAKPFYPLT